MDLSIVMVETGEYKRLLAGSASRYFGLPGLNLGLVFKRSVFADLAVLPVEATDLAGFGDLYPCVTPKPAPA
jgi:hypothetical protein